MSANNLTNPPSAPNETTVAAMQEARQMAAKTPRDKKESTLTKLKKGQLAEQKLCDLRLAFDEGFAIIREASVTPSSLLTELASVFHSNGIEPKFINRELVKKDIKLHKAEKEINATNAKRLKEALSENADLKSQLERMKQTTGTTGCPTPFFSYPSYPNFIPPTPFSGINTPGFQNMYAPPNSFPGQYPVPPFFTGQSSVNTESGQMPVSSNYPGYQARRDSLELSVADLARRVQNLESIAPSMLIKSTGSQNSGVVPPRLLNSLEIEVSNYVYKLLGERDGRSFTVSELIDFMIRNNFSWTSHVPLDTFPARWLSEMLPSLAACSGIGFTFTLDVCYDKGVVKAGQQFSHTGTDLTEEDQTVVFIKELFAFKTEYKIFDIKELYDYMVSKNYTPLHYAHLDQVVRKLAPRLGLNYTPSTKSSDGTVSVYQPEVFKKLLAAAVRFAIVGPNGLVTNWRGLDLIDSLCKETGVPLQLVQDYYKCWISHGIIVINTNALYNDYRDANGQMIPNITFNMNRVEALMKI